MFTPTRTILKVQAASFALNVTFLSPIEPDDLARQSFPFSYVYVDGATTDGKAHTIELYMDITGEWVTSDAKTPIQWQSNETISSAYLQVRPVSLSTNFQDLAEDGTVFHAMSSVRIVFFFCSFDLCYSFFRWAMKLNSTISPLISDLPTGQGKVENTDGKWPVLAHYVNLGSIRQIPTTAWAVGLVRHPVIIFRGMPQYGYYWSRWSTIGDAIDAFVADFPAANSRALALDNRILADAHNISPDYADLVSLGLRQALAGMELTLSPDNNGNYNPSNVVAFLKNNGNSEGVNPTETIYALMPALLYLNSDLLKALLEPLLQFQASSEYPNSYAAPDLGGPYPNVPGNTQDNHIMGVEHSANMIIMVLAYARTTGNGKLLAKYYHTLKTWGSFLINNTLAGSQDPADVVSAVPNLQIKGIIGVGAIAQISAVVGDVDAAKEFQAAVSNLTQVWMNSSSINGMMYNLFADKLLQLGTFPDTVRDFMFGLL
ncbi:hypothetical protein MKEN_00225100 [Mycena kentingensis (nom. inval.)]|nr:hypothetical protein MKEN_00225100 [Mycena kentingensis (nom. inval.)]